MATQIIRPNSNYNTLWGTYDYAGFDLTTTNPSTPSGTGGVVSSTDDNEAQEWGLAAPGSSGTITGAVVNIYGKYDNADGGSLSGFTVNLYLNSYLGSSQFSLSTSYGWVTKTYSSLSISTSGLTGRIQVTSPTMGKHESANFPCIYVELTYTPGGGGGSPSKSKRMLLPFLWD